MIYSIRYSKHIDWKRFRRLPADDKERIKHAIEGKLTVDPAIFGKPLRKSLQGCRSLRVGEYRIVYRIEAEFVEILFFGHRSTIYSDAERTLCEQVTEHRVH